MPIKVQIQKINSGVTFTVLNKDGSRCRGEGKRYRNAISKAYDWYTDEVRAAFEIANLSNIGYAKQFDRSILVYESDTFAHLDLEPWGFAIPGPDGEPAMNNTGSTPTEGRARVLACYQSPLHTERDGNTYTFKIVKEF